MLPYFSFSILLPLVLFLPSSVAGTKSPHCSSFQSSSKYLQHGSRSVKQRRISSAATSIDNNCYSTTIPRNHPQRIEGDQIRVATILQKLRGGDTTTTTAAGAAAAAAGAISSPSWKVNLMIESLDVFGTVVFAFSGALTAGRKGMDLIGMMIIACITATGGGTLRDVLMMGGGEEHVVFWMETPLYIEISLITALATFFLWPKFETKFGLEADSAVPICTSDALGLAAFCVVGVQAASKRGLARSLWVASGLMTATFGGIIRDVICGDEPRIMYPHRSLYALGPALGALTYTVLDKLVTHFQFWPLNNRSSITLISFLVAFTVRVLSFNKPWRMPHWNIKKDE